MCCCCCKCAFELHPCAVFVANAMKPDGKSRGRSLERAAVRLAKPRCKTLPTPRSETCERCGSPVRNWRKCPVCNWQPLDPICLKLHLDTDVYQCQAVFLRGIFTNWRGAMKRDEEIRGRSLERLAVWLARSRCKTLLTPRSKTCERCGSPVRHRRKCPIWYWQPLGHIYLNTILVWLICSVSKRFSC